MQKEKSVKSYTRRTKSGKTVVVHAYKAKYDAAEEIRKALAKKEGAGKELANRKKQVEQPIPDNKLGFSAEEFKAWYHWDMVDDPKNKAALKVEKALKKSMGVKAYNKFLDDMTDGYSARGHNKAFKGLESSLSSQKKAGNVEKPTSAKPKNGEVVTTGGTKSKKMGGQFSYSEKAGKDTFNYSAQFVVGTDGKYECLIKDKEDGAKGKWTPAIWEGYSSRELPAGVRKAAKELGLKFKDGEFVVDGKKPLSEPTSKNTSTKDKTSANHVTDEDGRKHSTKRNSLGISPAEWAVYNSGGVGIKGMSDKEVKTAIKHVESALKKNLGSKVKSFKEYLDDSAQGGGDFKADMKKLQGIISAKGSETSRAQNTPTDRPLTYGQAFKRAKDNFKKRKAAAKYEKPTDIKTLQSKGWQLHGRELPSLRSKKTQEAFLVSPDGKKMYRLSAAINPIGRGMIPMWRLNKNAELLDTTTAIRRKFEK